MFLSHVPGTEQRPSCRQTHPNPARATTTIPVVQGGTHSPGRSAPCLVLLGAGAGARIPAPAADSDSDDVQCTCLPLVFLVSYTRVCCRTQGHEMSLLCFSAGTLRLQFLHLGLRLTWSGVCVSSGRWGFSCTLCVDTTHHPLRRPAFLTEWIRIRPLVKNHPATGLKAYPGASILSHGSLCLS